MIFYYPLVFIGYLLTLFIGAMRPGILAAALMAAAFIYLILRKKMNIHNVMDVLIVVYFLYKAASVIWIYMSGMPIRVYAEEFAVSALPMIFYFVGKTCKDVEKFYMVFLISLLSLGFISLVLYILAPQFYCDYLYAWSHISKPDAATARVRMESVTGCTVFGAIMVCGMAVSIHFLCADTDKTASDNTDADNTKPEKTNVNKTNMKKIRILGLVSFVLTLGFTFLSNMRSAMVVAILLVLYVNYLIFARFKEIPRKYIFIEIAAVVLAFAALFFVKSDLIMKIWYRLESLPGAVSQRSEQWVAAVNNMYSSWFGNGLGMNGHKAIGVEGTHVIADGGLIKMYCEEGVLGFSLFVYIMFLTFKKGIKEIGTYYAEIALIAMLILQSIGSNVLAFQLITPLFWFAVGRVFVDSADKAVAGKDVN